MKKIAFQWYAIVEGCFLAALGLFFLQSSNLLVGGTAGIAAIANKAMPLTMGTWFFLVNTPFFLIAIKQMGKRFTVKSALAIAFVSVLTDTLNLLINFESIPVWLASFIGGGLIGIGLLLLFRHNTSLGGVNILALYLEKKHGIHSGKVILATDMLVVLFALNFFPLEQIAYSMIGFFVLTSVLGRYHKKPPISQQTSSVVETDSELVPVQNSNSDELEMAAK